jgi:transcriptional regulator with XRE-family HTH domain
MYSLQLFCNIKGEISLSNKLGDFIRQKRGKTSLRDFAKLCDISHTYLSTIEKGYDPRTVNIETGNKGEPTRISLETLKKLARGTGEDIEHLILLEMEDSSANNSFSSESDAVEILTLLNSNRKISHHGKELTKNDIEKISKALDLVLWDSLN